MRTTVLIPFLLLSPLFAMAQDSQVEDVKAKWETLSKSKANDYVAKTLSAASLYKPLVKWLLQQDADRIEDLADDGVDDYPKSAQLWYLRGRIHAIQAQNSVFSALSHAKDSLASFETAANLQPSEMVYQNGLLGFYQGAPSIAGGDTQKAITVAKKMIEINPREGYYALISLGYNKALPDTEMWLNQAKSALGDMPEFPYIEGINFQQAEQYDEARQAFENAVASQQNDEESEKFKMLALYQIGRNAVLEGQYSEASQQALERYISASPEQEDMPELSWARLRLAQIHAFNKNKAEAEILLASIDSNEDERLQDEIKTMKKRLKKMK